MSTSLLSERLIYKNRNNYGPEDEDWYQFVVDHKLYLRENSEIQRFTIIDLVPYKYRPDEFYKEKMNGDLDQTWVFMLTNDLRDSHDFNETITHLWMVKPDAIIKLRRLYEASAQYQAKKLAS